MTDYQQYELGNICTRLSSGKNILSSLVTDKGAFPVYGGNGLRGYTKQANFTGECAIIGRQGAFCGNVRYFSGKAYMTEHAVVACANSDNNTRYLSYLLSLMNLGRLSGQSAQPGLSVKTLAEQIIKLPPLETQNKVVQILSNLDSKIEVNRAINKNLEATAQAIFKSWFVDFEPFGGIMPADWKLCPLGTLVTIKRGASPRPIGSFLSDTGLRWLKISDATATYSPFLLKIKEKIKNDGLKSTIFLKAGQLVLSNSASPGIPKILGVDCCIHDGWLYFPEQELPPFYLYLLFKNIRTQLISLGNGSVFTNLKTDILKNFIVVNPSCDQLKKFCEIIVPMFELIFCKDKENQRLAAIRDALLPKLMSGEIDVSQVKI